MIDTAAILMMAVIPADHAYGSDGEDLSVHSCLYHFDVVCVFRAKTASIPMWLRPPFRWKRPVHI